MQRHKRLIAAITLIALLPIWTLLPATAYAGSNVSYIDETGTTQTVSTTTDITTASTALGTTGTTTWYSVPAGTSVTVSSRIVVSGDVRLILMDGSTFDASQGITVSNPDSLTVYAQQGSAGSPANLGALTTDQGSTPASMAGIGGDGSASAGDPQSMAGTITLVGGRITAYGGDMGAGIGGGRDGNGGTTTIYDAIVNASGANDSTLPGAYRGAGIGGGGNGSGGTIAIHGGIVNATGGGYGGAGIGSGGSYYNQTGVAASGGTILIDGGTVTARGNDSGNGGGAGIGSGGGDSSITGTGPSGEITITASANVTAYGGSCPASYPNSAGGGAAIGSGGTLANNQPTGDASTIFIDIPTANLSVTAGSGYSNGQNGAQVGTGGGNDPSLPGMPTLPTVPTDITVISNNTTVWVKWDPTQYTGKPITAYLVSYDDANWLSVGLTQMGNIFTGLTNGSTGTIWVRAENADGMGAIQAVNITAEAQVPNYPANLAATGGTQEVTVSWDAPNTISNVPYYPPSSSDGSPDGGSPITGYNVYYSTVDWAPWTLAGTTDASTTSFDVTGLANDTEYYFYVTAENAVGEGQVPYPTVSAMTFDVPGAVATFDVHSGSGGQDIKVSWTPPATDGGTPVTDYVIYWGTDIYSWTSSATVDASTLSYDVSGLTEGQPYFFSVAAVNAAGSGPLFTPALGATPVTVPSAPQNLAASPSDSAVTLTWHAPADDGGTAILYYDLSSDGGQSWTASATADTMNYTFTGLTNGSSYDLAVRAVNAQGPSAAAPISATPLSVPSMVQNFVAQPDPPTSFDLSWAAPASDGGSAITGYVISWSDDGGSTWSAPVNLDASTTSYTATGLTDGVDYTFQISATNALGSSPVAQSSATDATAPGAVQALTATPADSSVALTWQTPADDGGSPILYYDISTDGGLSWTATTTATNYTATGLTNGTSYDLSVRAENAVEAGLISTVTTTPATVPSRVMSAIWWDSDYTLTPHWTPPADGGSPILYYTVDVKTEAGVEVAGSPYTIPSTGDTTYILPITPLNNGQFYEVNITATNAMGTSLPADYTVQCIGNAPEPLSATATVISANQVTLTWVPGVNTSGVGIIGYYYQESSDGGITWGNTVSAGGSTATTDTITVPTGQELIFKVGSRNSATYSAAALTNSVFIAVPPTAPTGVTATVGPDAGAVTVDWTALTTNFGSPLTDYTVYWSTDGSSWDASQTVPSTATSDEITGLTPGQEYYFAVTASNALGEGVQSTPAVTATTLATAAQPTGLSGTLGNNQVALTWNAPASDGGSTITGYDVYMSTDGTNYSLVPASQLSQPSASSPSATVTGLTNGTPYYFQVVPVTAAGEGASSDPISVTPAAVASSVSSFEATATSPTSMDLSWTAPTDNGAAITSYTITYSSDGGLTFSAPVTVAAPATSTSLTGLTPGANYIIGIVAQNAAGGSVASTVNASTWATPAVPANFSALSGDGQVTLNWQPPTDSGGTPITGYEVSDDGGVTWIDIPSAEATSYTFTGLTNGTSYNFVMRALNAAGTGAESTLSAAPSATPSAPGNVGNLTVTPGDGDATINWSNPSDTGGSAITGYVITWEPGSGQTTVTAPTNTYTIPGLNNGTDYTITISPINNTGVGDSTTIGVTPQTSYSVLADYGTWTGTGTAFAEVDGPISDFIRLETAAGVVVPATNYVVTEGSTITTFSIAYLNTLANGTYHYKMIFSGGASDLLTLIIARPASGGGGGSNTGNGGAGGGNSRNANNTNNGTNNGSNGGSGSNSGSGSNNGSINTGNNTHRTATRQPAQHPSRMPKTGDDLFNYLPFMLMSLVILAITAESIRRTKKRNELEPLPDDSE